MYRQLSIIKGQAPSLILISDYLVMKTLLTFLLFGISLSFFAQDDGPDLKKEKDLDLYVSMGAHLGFWYLLMDEAHTGHPYKNESAAGSTQIPWNIHIDKVFDERYALGLGYSYDKMAGNPLTTSTSNIPAIRQNLRIRFYRFHRDPEKRFSYYTGASVGISKWEIINGTFYFDEEIKQDLWPSAQFLFGTKVKLNDALFWETEFAIGPPYACQTSIGIKF